MTQQDSAHAADQLIEPPRQGGGPQVPHGMRKWLTAGIGLVGIGSGAAQITTQILNLPLKIEQVNPQGATASLSIVLGVGTILQLVFFPLFGRASDRTTSKFGRRRPWLVAGAALFAAGGLLMFYATTVPVVVLGWSLNSLGYAAAAVPATALIADQFEAGKRGIPSALMGVGPALGALVGLFLSQLTASQFAASFFLPILLGVAAPVLLAVIAADKPISKADRTQFTASAFFSTFWVNPRRYPDYAFAWGSRFALFLGVAAAKTYEVFFLIAVLHVPHESIAGTVFLAELVGTGTSFIIAPLVSRISDRVRRRKPFVIGAAVIFAAGLAMIATARDLPSFIIAFGVFGIGQGVYLAVDLALVTDILPADVDAAKDLGIMNLANSVPSSIVPLIAPALLAVGAADPGDQNFTVLFGFGTVAALIGAALILPIRGTR